MAVSDELYLRGIPHSIQDRGKTFAGTLNTWRTPSLRKQSTGVAAYIRPDVFWLWLALLPSLIYSDDA